MSCISMVYGLHPLVSMELGGGNSSATPVYFEFTRASRIERDAHNAHASLTLLCYVVAISSLPPDDINLGDCINIRTTIQFNPIYNQ
jgi:hypothetical protein